MVIDYGQVPSIVPNLKKGVILRRRESAKNYIHTKYIKNKYLNSKTFKHVPGFSLVGLNKETSKWRLIRVWGYTDAL